MEHRCYTFAYKRLETTPLELYLDLYPPNTGSTFTGESKTTSPSGKIRVPERDAGKTPCLVYFHGGGMTVGDRKTWFPTWLHQRVTSAGIAFISADYRLIPPCTGHDILSDLRDLFDFLSTHLNAQLFHSTAPRDGSEYPLQIDCDRVGVAGSSAGGLCAYLAAAHCEPRPKVVVSLYGMGGDFLTPHYLVPKTRPFFRGRELLSPHPTFSPYLHPTCHSLPQLSGSQLEYYHDGESEEYPKGYPKNRRMQLTRVYLQMGVFLDYWTGLFGECNQCGENVDGAGEWETNEPRDKSLSEQLREVLQCDGVDEEEKRIRMRSLIPPDALRLFPQYLVDTPSAWPATFLIHGELDTAVLAQESKAFYNNIRRLHHDSRAGGSEVSDSAGVVLRVVSGEEHSFDYQPGANDKYGCNGGLYDEVLDFVKSALL